MAKMRRCEVPMSLPTSASVRQGTLVFEEVSESYVEVRTRLGDTEKPVCKVEKTELERVALFFHNPA